MSKKPEFDILTDAHIEAAKKKLLTQFDTDDPASLERFEKEFESESSRMMTWANKGTPEGFNFYGCSGTDICATISAEVLKSDHSWDTMLLGDNKITDVGAVVLAEALKTNNITTHFHIEDNRGITDVGVVAIAEALKINDTVESMNLSVLQITDVGVFAIAEALKENRSLTRLVFTCNKVTDAGAAAFANMLKTNRTLTELNLWGNCIGSPGMFSLARAIKMNGYTELLLQNQEGGKPESRIKIKEEDTEFIASGAFGAALSYMTLRDPKDNCVLKVTHEEKSPDSLYESILLRAMSAHKNVLKLKVFLGDFIYKGNKRPALVVDFHKHGAIKNYIAKRLSEGSKFVSQRNDVMHYQLIITKTLYPFQKGVGLSGIKFYCHSGAELVIRGCHNIGGWSSIFDHPLNLMDGNDETQWRDQRVLKDCGGSIFRIFLECPEEKEYIDGKDAIGSYELVTCKTDPDKDPISWELWTGGKEHLLDFRDSGLPKERLTAKRFNVCAGNFSVLDYLKLALGMAEAVQHMHKHNLLHRDIAARNFVISENHDPVIIDFGCSIPIEYDEEQIYALKDERFAWRHCPPELFEKGFFVQNSDVWMLGVAFWQMLLLCGGTPFFYTKSSSKLRELLRNKMVIQQNNVPLIFTAKSPRAIIDLCAFCCKHDHKIRPSSDEVVEEIKRLLETVPEYDVVTKNEMKEEGIVDSSEDVYLTADKSGSEYVAYEGEFPDYVDESEETAEYLDGYVNDYPLTGGYISFEEPESVVLDTEAKEDSG